MFFSSFVISESKVPVSRAEDKPYTNHAIDKTQKELQSKTVKKNIIRRKFDSMNIFFLPIISARTPLGNSINTIAIL
jgi:hypothetical protein